MHFCQLFAKRQCYNVFGKFIDIFIVDEDGHGIEMCLLFLSLYVPIIKF